MKQQRSSLLLIFFVCAFFFLLLLFIAFIPLLKWSLSASLVSKSVNFSPANRQIVNDLESSYTVWYSFFDSLACLLVGGALIAQVFENKRHAREVEIQRVQGIFFPSLSLFDAFVQRLALDRTSAFVMWDERLGEEPSREDITRFIEDNGHQLAAYCNHLVTVCSCILKSGIDPKEKREYLHILTTRLSKEEIIVLKHCSKATELRGLRGICRMFGDGEEPDWLKPFRGENVDKSE